MTMIVKYNGSDRYVTFTLGTSYFNTNMTTPQFNVTGVDNQGNNYTGVGFYDKYYKFIVKDLIMV